MILGAAAHHLLLGEDNFKLKFVAQPETYRDRKTAEEKQWTYQAIACQGVARQQEDEGKVVVTVKELKSIVQMAKSLALEPLVNDGLLSGHVECSGFWKDKETGLWIKVRPDVIPPTGDDFVDLKTAAEVTTPALQSSIRTYGYHQQGALIGEVCEALGLPFSSFMLMFIETASPYCARTVPVVPEDLGRGRQMNRSALRKIKASLEAGHWMGPGEGELVELGISNDERARTDARLKAEGLLHAVPEPGACRSRQGPPAPRHQRLLQLGKETRVCEAVSRRAPRGVQAVGQRTSRACPHEPHRRVQWLRKCRHELGKIKRLLSGARLPSEEPQPSPSPSASPRRGSTPRSNSPR